MGNSSSSIVGFVKDVGKAVAKGATSFVGSKIPFVGPRIADYLNSKYAIGSEDLHGHLEKGNMKNLEKKSINSPVELKKLIEAFPKEAEKNGISTSDVTEAVQELKEQSKAIGGTVKFINKRPPVIPIVQKKEASMAIGGIVKVKKQRTAAQIAATKKLVELNKAKRAHK
jgi:hypothetical protein